MRERQKKRKNGKREAGDLSGQSERVREREHQRESEREKESTRERALTEN